MIQIKKFLIIYGILSLFFVYGLIQLLCCFFTMPFAERFTINELDSLALAINENVTFILLIFSSVILVISFISNFFIGIKLFSLSLNQYSIFQKIYLKKILWKTTYTIILIASMILSFIMFFVYLYNFFYIKKNIDESNPKLVLEKLKFSYEMRPYNHFIKIASIVTPIALVAVSAIPTAVVLTAPKKLYINQNDINNFLKLSNNHENTILLYFDRAQGLMWNSLLWYDQYINKENSFISKFPEFTSYIKTFSQGRVTSTSNPSLVSGPLYSSWMNNVNQKSLYSNENYEDMDMIQFWNEAFYNSFKALNQNGVSDIHIASVPYYSYNGSEYGKPNLIDVPAKKLNNEITDPNNKVNFAFTTNEAIAANKLNYEKANRLTNAMALKEASNLLNYENTNGGVYQGWYFHHTHENYCFYDFIENKYVEATSTDYQYFMQSIWFTIQTLKTLLDKLKNEPWSDGKEISNIYDHSQILIVSDHGYSMPKNNDSVNKLLSLTRNVNNITPDFNPKDYVLLSYNSIFMMKPFAKNVQANENKHFFDQNTFILSSDIPLIIEEGLNQYRDTNNQYFYPDLNLINDAYLRNYFKQIIVNNPLQNKDKLSLRTVKLEVSDWRFVPSWHYMTEKTFNIDVRNKDYYQLISSKIDFNKSILE